MHAEHKKAVARGCGTEVALCCAIIHGAMCLCQKTSFGNGEEYVGQVGFSVTKSDHTTPFGDPTLPFATRVKGSFVVRINLLATWTLGAAFTSPVVATVRRWGDHAVAPPAFPGRVALVAHAFYVDVIGEILTCLGNLPVDADLILTVPQEAHAEAAQILESVPGVHLAAVPNRGRDIAPFLRLLHGGYLDPYEVVLKLHSKRSPHLRDGEIRRRLLFTMLAGSRRRVARVLFLFADEQTGLVGWRASWRKGPLFWMHNRPWIGKLGAAMNIPVREAPSFFEGSMFWVRPRALRRLRRLELATERFEAEAGQTDGMLHHAVERLFAAAVAAEGYRARDLRGRSLA